MTQQKPRTDRVKKRPVLTFIGAVAVALIVYFLWQGGVLRGVQPEIAEAPVLTEPSTVADEVGAGGVSASDSANLASDESDGATEVPAPVQQQVSNLPTIDYAELPPEAHDTIALIDSNGPFPYSKDGSTFQNREGILPDREAGYYAEYTVITPGSDDRGARRIVGGADGELYYTDDHYNSFREIMR